MTSRGATRGWLLADLLLIVVILSFATLNIKSSHNWGDDFAEYIAQARNIVEHRPQQATGVVQNEFSRNYLLPPATPVGLPILLAPFYAAFGNSIFHFGVLMALCYALFVFFAFVYYRYNQLHLHALLLALLIATNPWLINFKASILSDLPFTVFTTLTICLLLRFVEPKVGATLLIGSVAGFAMAIRPAAVPLLAAIAAYAIYESVRRPRGKRLPILFQRGAIVVLALLVGTLLNSVIFQTGIGSSYFSYYFTRATGVSSQDQLVVGSVLAQYRESALSQKYTITSMIPPRSRGSLLVEKAKQGVLILMAIGFLWQMRRPRLVEFFTIAYMGMIVVSKIGRGQGFRYLLPLMPFLYEYVFVILVLISINFRRFVVRWGKLPAASPPAVGPSA